MCGTVRPSLRTDLFRGGIMMPSQLPGAEWWMKEGENKGREERVGERGQGERKQGERREGRGERTRGEKNFCGQAQSDR